MFSKNQKAFMALEIVTAVVVLGAFIVGFATNYFTKKVDSPLEQISESVLREKGIEYDFSADDKVEND